MAVKIINPTTPGRRHHIANDFAALTKVKPHKKLLYAVKRKGGRNNSGKITVPHRGGGHKKRGRVVDLIRCKYDVPATVQTIERDPMRSAFIMLVAYTDGAKKYLLAPEGIKVGDKVVAGENISPDVGNVMPLSNIPVGTIVHNVALRPQGGGVLARSAGCHAQLVACEGKNAVIKLPSGEMRMVNKACTATVGTVSNGEHRIEVLGKAGRKRWLGRRPTVRGVAQNPVDHPNGGGEGKSKGGQLTSRKGIPKGKVTRKKNKHSSSMIIKRRKKHA